MSNIIEINGEVSTSLSLTVSFVNFPANITLIMVAATYTAVAIAVTQSGREPNAKEVVLISIIFSLI